MMPMAHKQVNPLQKLVQPLKLDSSRKNSRALDRSSMTLSALLENPLGMVCDGILECTITQCLCSQSDDFYTSNHCKQVGNSINKS